MSNVIKRIADNKLAKVILEIGIFILCLPVLTIVGKSIFAIGQLVGTATRIMGY